MIMTEDDIELLRLAAKAAGYELKWWSHLRMSDSNGTRDLEPKLAHIGDSNRVWNPLESNDDAFRLMFDLDIWITNVMSTKRGGYTCAEWDDLGSTEWHKNHPDKYAASRRAIVRMAALIGSGKFTKLS